MTRVIDVQGFDRRAAGYENGRLGRMHQDIASRCADLISSRFPGAARVLDVGCGTGFLLRELAGRLPGAIVLAGVDTSEQMIAQVWSRAADRRIRCARAAAEQLPFAAGSFDLVVAATSFDHWSDQAAGLSECRRVLSPGGHLILTDLFSPWLAPTLVGPGRDRARTPLRATRLLAQAGFRAIRWHRHYAVIIRSVTAAA